MEMPQIYTNENGDVLVLVSNNPTCITNGYATIKEMRNKGIRFFDLMVEADTVRQGLGAWRRLERATDSFLDVKLTYRGRIGEGHDNSDYLKTKAYLLM